MLVLKNNLSCASRVIISQHHTQRSHVSAESQKRKWRHILGPHLGHSLLHLYITVPHERLLDPVAPSPPTWALSPGSPRAAQERVRPRRALLSSGARKLVLKLGSQRQHAGTEPGGLDPLSCAIEFWRGHLSPLRQQSPPQNNRVELHWGFPNWVLKTEGTFM